MTTPPFVFGRLATDDNFVDREAERARLTANFTNLTNTAIISPRRWGKSSLVRRVATDLTAADPKTRVCLIDLFNVRSEADFYAHLAHGVMSATMTKVEEWVDAAGRFLGHLRPTVSIAPDLTSSITLDVDWKVAEKDPDEVLDLAERLAQARKVKLIVCLDEFQSVATLATPTESAALQRKLRAHWQQHQHVAYCLYGSKRHMLMDIFSNPEMPFYRFGDILPLEKIDNAVWGRYIVGRFAATRKTIAPDQARRIAALVDNHSYYVQQLAQQVWFRTANVCADDAIAGAFEDLTDQLDLLFTGLAASLSRRQLNFLRAVRAGETALTSQGTIRTYDLGTSANVIRLREALVNREIIDLVGGRVEFLDPLFAHWLATRYFGNHR